MSENLINLAEAIRKLDSKDFDMIDNATRERLLATEFDDTDNHHNRVSCKSIVVNALFDIRDAIKT